MEYRIFIWSFMRSLNHFFIFWKLLPVLWQKPKLLQRRAFYYSYFPFEGYFYHEGLLKEHLTITWFENGNLDFLAYLWLFLDFLECFTLYHLLVLKESVDQAKWQRNLGFGIYVLFIIIYWLQSRFFENLANQAAMDRITSKY